MVAEALGTGWLAFVVSFVAFRLLDIFKPCPISFFEHWGPSWWSIMADDVAAAIVGGGTVIVLASFI
jgi:phosphatidylglycerophosphatase A